MTFRRFNKKTLRILGCISGFWITVVLVFLPLSTQAQCEWNATGQRFIYQARLESVIVMTLVQEGGIVAGNASRKVNGRTVTGRVTGSIDGDNFSVEIAWTGGLTGVYNAPIFPTGKMIGGTYDKSNPRIMGNWRTEEPLKCIAPPQKTTVTPPPPPKPKPKPLKSGGKAPKPAPPPPMRVPGIITSQVIYPHPSSLNGSTILTWDAGPDHPYAEVWFSIGGPGVPPVFLVEQGKGSRQIPVERGKYYIYTLTDGGKTLAEVAFVAP